MISKLQLIIFFFITTIFIFACSENNNPTEGAAGKNIFTQNCVSCHGTDGKLGVGGAKDLSQSLLTQAERELVITHGRNAMMAYQSILSEAQIKDVAAYTLTLKK